MSLLREWLDRNKPNQATEVAIDRWQLAIDEPEEALALLEDFEAWLNGDKSKPAPDLVMCIAQYEHTQLLLQNWRLPINVPESQFDKWRAEYHHMTLEDFRPRVAGVAGGFLELGGKDPGLTLQIIQQQLAKKLADLREYANLPLKEYTPQFTEEALRLRYTAEGLSADTIEGLVGEHMSDSDEFDEQDHFDRPFVLRQQLECFVLGMDRLRSLCISEQAPDLGLPNRELFDALMQIDLADLTKQYEAADPQLRHILQHLAGYRYYHLDNDAEPEQFWWRHLEKARKSR